ncbi:transglycosylase SLT domain-containing protein [Amycolatopsis sp.]|jgi:hypothetical protein|uniref:transglycosylase SLT domain-containing protein n=1 Tax=Amycolatopsis sp. TaxID=37632 RepID=UPI002DF98F0B|nr:transglycosylase SLT domain-containing protein [Amycolatopsis sp.]
MAKLTPEQIAEHAYRAGFRGQGLTTAVAVALAESGGNTRAHNATPPDNSYGLWQINMLGGMGPERRKQYHLDSNAELFDADANAKVANSLSQDGKSWTPWSTYTNGAYRDHLTAARRAAHTVTSKHHKPSKPGATGDGFAVETGVLGDYVKRARAVADNLSSIDTKHLHGVRKIADDSFGRIGKESGFADALGDFSSALHKQVKGVSANADALAVATGKMSRTYREQETDHAKALGRH